MVWTQESACMMAVGMEKLQSAAQGGVSSHSPFTKFHKYSLQRIALNFMLQNTEKSG